VAWILFSAANGERQGLAAADVIFGKVDPSGHLSFTWYAGDGELPKMSDYNLTPDRTGGLGRTYMYFTRTPAWPFGFGMSYTRFRYSHVRFSRRRIAASGTLRVSLRVTNTGRRPGATVVQLYAAPPSVAGVTLPKEKLVGFRRTRVLAPRHGQRIAIAVPLIPALRMWSAQRGREVVYPGTWRFRLARSSADAIRTRGVQITGAIPPSIATVSLAPPALTLQPGQTLDLRGRNPWLDGLAPTQDQTEGDTIVSAVRRDDSFVDTSSAPLRFNSDRPDVLRVDANGIVSAVAPGVATVTVTLAGASASAPFVVAG